VGPHDPTRLALNLRKSDRTPRDDSSDDDVELPAARLDPELEYLKTPLRDGPRRCAARDAAGAAGAPRERVRLHYQQGMTSTRSRM